MCLLSHQKREGFCQLLQQMKNKHSEKPEPDMITVFVGTWNMGNTLVNILHVWINLNYWLMKMISYPQIMHQEMLALPTTSTPGFSVRAKGRHETTARITSRMIFTSLGLRRILWVRGSGPTRWRVSWGSSQTSALNKWVADKWTVRLNAGAEIHHIVFQHPGGDTHSVEHSDCGPCEARARKQDLPHFFRQREDGDCQHSG